ncbi:unnamed protein product [Caenorhabditis angaria]|uniref:DUF1308 domain-containing protein n=1 Tax=Caenorhabditis angaria TaxID=860376 RepID=A0A9P1I931_9PELO|nr:unnamed protein product [Caenorhabditis angaria]
MEENELIELLNKRCDQCLSAMEELSTEKFEKIDGVGKMKNRLESEKKFLKAFKTGEKRLEMKYLETSNVSHLQNIISQAAKLDDVTAILHTFAIRDTDIEIEENRGKPVTIKHMVDIVAKNGKQWVKVISRSARGILMDWMTGCSRNIFEQADDYLTMSRKFQQQFIPPQVCFIFISGVPDKIAEKLERKNVIIIGKRIDTNSLAKIPEEYLEMLEEDSEDSDYSDEENEEDSNSELGETEEYQNEKRREEKNEEGKIEEGKKAAVNLDVSAVFVLISNMTHENGTNHKFASTLLEQQAEQERKISAREELLPQIQDRRWVMCKTAFDSVNRIMKTVSGEQEKIRWEKLAKNIQVYEDCISERTKKLKESDRINNRNLIIFGSGDYYRAITVTANKHFLSSAYHQGVSFDAIIHESRALSEQKERPIDWIAPPKSKKLLRE